MIAGVPMCRGCAHFHPETPELQCDAFPEGIPISILLNTQDHRFPVAGDNGIRYEPKADGKRYGLALYPKVQPEPHSAR